MEKAKASIYIRKIKDGVRYDVKFYRLDGTQGQKTFRTKREADNFKAQVVADKNRGVLQDDRTNKVTFELVASEWLESNPTKRERTRDRDKGILSLHLLPVFGKQPIRKIKREHITDLIKSWVDHGYSPSTIQRMKAVLSGIFNFALAEEIIHRSPVFKIKTPRVDARDGHPLTAQEAQKLLGAIEPHFYPLVFIMVTTGLRWSEAAGLEVKHFDPLKMPPSLTVEQSLHSNARGKVIEATKSRAANRVIPLSQTQVDAINKHLEDTNRSISDIHSPLFTSPNGESLDYSNFRERYWTKAVHQAGLDHVTIRDLRMTAATNLINAGVDLKTVTTLMGHEDIKTTLRHYTQAKTANLVHASEVLVNAIAC
jgi:integrase